MRAQQPKRESESESERERIGAKENPRESSFAWGLLWLWLVPLLFFVVFGCTLLFSVTSIHSLIINNGIERKKENNCYLFEINKRCFQSSQTFDKRPSALKEKTQNVNAKCKKKRRLSIRPETRWLDWHQEKNVQSSCQSTNVIRALINQGETRLE